MSPTGKKATATTTESDFPAWWDFDDPADGDELSGTFLGLGQGQTAMGPRVFVELEVAGVQRTLWLHQVALHSQFRREVERRPDKMIHSGETVIVRRIGDRESSNGRTYTDFKVEFPDGPLSSQADLLGIGVKPSGQPTENPVGEAAGELEALDDIPF